MEMVNKYFFSVPAPLLLFWRDGNGKTSYYYKTKQAEREKFMFSVPDDLDGEKLDYDELINVKTVSFLNDVFEGKIKFNRDSVYSAWVLYNCIYTQNLLGVFAGCDYSGSYAGKDENTECIDDLILLKSYEKGDLTMSVVKLALENFMHDAEYVCDLSLCLLEAPQGKGFVFGDNPVLFFNPFQIGRERVNADCFDSYGFITAVPVSPTTAICFYDDFVYKVKNKSGVVQLDRDDIDHLNACVIHQSSSVLYNRDLTTKKNLDLLYGVKDSSIVETVHDRNFFRLELSPFSIRARAEEDIVEKGRIPEKRYGAVERYSTFDDKALHEEIMEKYLSKYDS